MIEQIQNVLYDFLFVNADMSQAQTSQAQPIQGITCYAVQYIWSAFTGTGSEMITTSGSNDGVNWTQVDNFIPMGTTGSTMLNVEKAGYRFVQVVYTPATSSGSLTVSISGKVI